MNPDRTSSFSPEPAQQDTNDESYILRTRLHELVPALGADTPDVSSQPVAPFRYKSGARNYRPLILIAIACLLVAIAAALAWRERSRTPELLGKGKRLLEQVIQPLQSNHLEQIPVAIPAAKHVTIRSHQAQRPFRSALNVEHGVTRENELPSSAAAAVGTLASLALWDREHPRLIMAPISPMRLHIGPHESPAYLLRRVSPSYPEAARKARIQGTVVLKAAISRYGTVDDLQPVSGPYLLVGAAMEAVRYWQYRPYWVEGVPQPFETMIVVDFSLAEATPAP